MSRMSLSNVSRGRLAAQPLRLLIQGQEGVGKSTFGAAMPKPIFLAAEDGTARLDVERFPAPATWLDAFEAVAELTRSPHDYRTLVVDTVDWLEALCHAHVAQAGRKPDIEAFGFGKGYTLALDQWRQFVLALDRLRAERSIAVLLLAHTHRKVFVNPSGDDFDRYEMKLHRGSGAFLREWSDEVYFAAYDVATAKDGVKAKAFSSGKRLLRTAWSAAYDAKSRASVADPLPLEWPAVAAALASKDGPTDEQIAAECDALLKLAPAEWSFREAATTKLSGDRRCEQPGLGRLHDRLKEFAPPKESSPSAVETEPATADHKEPNA